MSCKAKLSKAQSKDLAHYFRGLALIAEDLVLQSLNFQEEKWPISVF